MSTINSLQKIPQITPSLAKNGALHEYQMKWNLDRMTISKYQFTGTFPKSTETQQIQKTLLDIINRPENKDETLNFKQLNCNQISMEFFDKLYNSDPKILHESGRILHCLQENRHEICPGVCFRDQLIKALLNYEEDEYCCFNEADRDEFLFRIFQFLVIGGPINQYEEDVNIYLDGTRSLYKDMISVYKDDGKVKIDSKVFEVYVTQTLNNSGNTNSKNDDSEDEDVSQVVFPDVASNYEYTHPQSFCYVVVNEKAKVATVFENVWSGQK